MISDFKKFLLIIAGSLSLIMGLIGIVVPLLPTTPFLLLSAACFFKSSNKLYNKLISTKYLGSYIKNYREKKGVPKKVKIMAISILWATILFSAIFIVNLIWVKILLFVIASAVTFHISKLKTVSK